MAVVISLLRGVNVGGHHKIRMEELRTLYESLELGDPRTYIQSGNVVFRSGERDLQGVAGRIEEAIERRAGFRPAVILRSLPELRKVVARNPFAARPDVEPGKLAVLFLADAPGPEVRERVLRMETGPEELRMERRELYIYFPNGMARPKLSMAAVERALRTPVTGRNWNSVRKLLELAEELEVG